MFTRESKLALFKSDFLIVGGGNKTFNAWNCIGIIGLNVAKSLFKKYPKAIVHVLE